MLQTFSNHFLGCACMQLWSPHATADVSGRASPCLPLRPGDIGELRRWKAVHESRASVRAPALQAAERARECHRSFFSRSQAERLLLALKILCLLKDFTRGSLPLALPVQEHPTGRQSSLHFETV